MSSKKKANILIFAVTAVVLVVFNILVADVFVAALTGSVFGPLLVVAMWSSCKKKSTVSDPTYLPEMQPGPGRREGPQHMQFRTPQMTYTSSGQQPVFMHPMASPPPTSPSYHTSAPQELDVRFLPMPRTAIGTQSYDPVVPEHPPEYSTLGHSVGAPIGFTVPYEAPPVANESRVFQPSADGLPSYEVAVATKRVDVEETSPVIVTRRSNSMQDATQL